MIIILFETGKNKRSDDGISSILIATKLLGKAKVDSQDKRNPFSSITFLILLFHSFDYRRYSNSSPNRLKVCIKAYKQFNQCEFLEK